MERGRTRRLTWGLFGVGVVVLWMTVGKLAGPLGVLAALVCFAPALRALTASADRPADEPVAAAALALALLAVAVLFRPLSALPLPDIGALGRYTYLATEVAFGTLAFVLLFRAGRESLLRAARTIAVIYPLAYAWDWYTLEVGVFAIPLRTGVEFVGIPLEEHLFMVVVPALILGVHETLNRRDTDT
ncbi:lycopene cyclase domain-containing protein [Halosimplex amylolyticum]|uniref:lycopene cyclase domain-containing protein n=1 Tax=Halosimplex amylolyticum TaxID=3396616 RepID=UPI003F55A398